MNGVLMSDNQEPSSEQNSQKQAQTNNKPSSTEGQKRSAPENPPATPSELRTSSVNFNEDKRVEASKQQKMKGS